MKCPSVLFFVLTTGLYSVTSKSVYPDISSKCRETNLHSITKDGSLEEVKEGISQASEDMYQADCQGKTPVHIAVDNSYKSKNLLLAFINADFNVNHRFSKGNTILFYAVQHGSLDAVKTLLEFGSLADEVNDEGSTPLFEAVNQTRKDVCQLLVENGANLSRSFPGGNGYLNWFADNGTAEQVSLLVKLGAPTDMRNAQGLNAIRIAILRRSVSMLNVFLAGTVDCSLGYLRWREYLDMVVFGPSRFRAYLVDRLILGPCWIRDVKRLFDVTIKENHYEIVDQIFTDKKKGFLQAFGKATLLELMVANNTEGLNYLFNKGLNLTSSDVFPCLFNPRILQNMYIVKLVRSHSPPLENFELNFLIRFYGGTEYDPAIKYLVEANKDKKKGINS